MDVNSKGKSMTNGLMKCLLSLVAVFGAGALSAQPVLADESAKSDEVSVTLSDTENGSLKFKDTDEKKVSVDKGTEVEVSVSPDKGYESSDLIAVGDDGSVSELTVKDGVTKVKADQNMTVGVTFVAKDALEKLKESKDGIAGINEVSDIKKEKVNSDLSYIQKNLNKDLVGTGDLKPADYIEVASLLADGTMLKDKTIDGLWKSTNADGISDNWQAILYQQNSYELLYEASGENGDYFVANVKSLNVDNSTLSDELAGKNDGSGTVYDDVKYDKETGLIYVPKTYRVIDGNKAKVGSVRVQMFYTTNEAVKDASDLKNKFDVKINADNVKGVSASGSTENELFGTATAINIKGEKGIEDNTIDSVVINGIEYESGEDNTMFAYDDGTLVLNKDAATIRTVEVNMSNTSAKTRELKSGDSEPMTANAFAAVRASTSVGGTWQFTKDIYNNSAFKLAGTNGYARGGKSGYAQPTMEASAAAGNQEVNQARRILNGTMSFDPDTAYTMGGGIERYAEVKSQTAGVIDSTSEVTTPAFNLNLYCAHVGVNGSFGQDDGYNNSAMSDSYGIFVRVLKKENGVMWFGAVNPTMNTQAGFGIFSINYEIKPQDGYLNITKISQTSTVTSGNNAYDLAGAEYGVYTDKAATKKVGTLTTKADGSTNTLTLEEGTYYVKETKAPNKGYEINTNVLAVKVTADKTNSVKLDGTMAEPPLYDPFLFTLNKTADGQASANGDVASYAGIQYRVTHYKGIYTTAAAAKKGVSDGSAVFATDKNGTLNFSNSKPVSGTWNWQDPNGKNTSPLGTLVIEEIKTLPGLTLNTTPAVVTVQDSGDHKTVNIKMVAGWSDTSSTAPKFENDIYKGGVSVVKADSESNTSVAQGDATLEGVTYTITNKSAAPVTVSGKSYKVGEVVATIKTAYDSTTKQYVAKSGTVLPYGTYQITETNPSTGYNNAKWTQTFSIRTDGQVVNYNTSANKWNTNDVFRGGVKVVKADNDLNTSYAQGDATLEGVTYDIVNKSKASVIVDGKTYAPDAVVKTIKTTYDADSKQYVAQTAKDALPYGTYQIVETNPSTGYHNAEWTQTFSIRTDGQMINYDTSDNSWNRNPVIRGGVKVVKADFDLNQSVAQGDATLAGVTYDITNKSKANVVVDGKEYKPGEVVKTITTVYDETAKQYIAQTSADSLPYGSYTITETNPSTGYHNAKWSQSFTIRSEGQIATYDTATSNWNTNKVHRGGLSIRKYDLETNQFLPLGDSTLEGTTFNVVNLSKAPVYVNGKVYGVNEIIMGISTVAEKNSKGEIEYVARVGNDVLPYGTYGVYETGASVGYLPTAKNTGFVYEVHENGKEGKVIANATVKVGSDNKVEFTRSDVDKYPGIVKNQVKREDLTFKKKAADSQDRMVDIPFLITSKTTGEKHIIVTDENGIFNSEVYKHSSKTNSNDPTSPITNGAIVEKDGKWVVVDSKKLDSEAGVWFTGVDPALTKWAEDGKSYTVNGQTVPVNDSLRAFPYDKYTIEELRCDNNASYNLITVGVTLHGYGDENGNGINLDYGTLDDAQIGVATTLKYKDTNMIPNVDKDSELVDTLETWGLTVGRTYNFKGEIHAFDENNKDLGVVATANKDMKAKTPYGTYKVEFTVNGSKLPAGTNKLVAYETIYYNGDEITQHADATDEDQTIMVPSIGTTLTFDNEHVAPSVGKVTIVDIVSYKNLDVGKSYKMTGTLQDKSTGKPYLDKDGKEITATTEFTPTTPNGTVDVPFTFEDSSLNAGKKVVAFESLTLDDEEFAVHTDINDEGQTIAFPKIGTTATDNETGDHVGTASDEITINDVVKYENLNPGTEYTVTGTAHLKTADGKDGGVVKDANGNDVVATKKFTPTESSGEVTVSVTFKPASDFSGNTVVMFEDVAKGDVLYAIHADITDEKQTVHYPKIGTSLTDKDGDQIIDISKDTVKLTDKVSYENLVVGEEYTVNGTLMLDENTPLQYDGKDVTGTATFTAKKSSGTVDVEFEFGLDSVKDVKQVVAFESLVHKGKEVTRHKDINDKGQTIVIPEIGTKLATLTGGNEVLEDGTVELTDTVSYTGLLVGKEYTMTGTLMIDEDTPLTIDDKPVTGTTTFTPTTTDGTVDVKFEFDSSALKDVNQLVAFEELTFNSKLVAKHKDIEDKNQTVQVPKISTKLATIKDGKEVLSDGTAELVDTIEYKNLTPGTEYEMTGTLMIDENTPLTIDGKTVTNTVKFTPEESSGTVDVPFTFDASYVKEVDKLIAFEGLTNNSVLVAKHTDIADKDQTVQVPRIGTKLATIDGGKEVLRDGKVELVDTIEYHNLTPGTEYEMTGTLMIDKDTPLMIDDKPVTNTVKFTPEESSGTVDVPFTFDADAVKDIDKLVAFEQLTNDSVLVAKHEDIADGDQTVQIPEIGTKLATINGGKEVLSNGDVELVDTVEYKNLTPGTEYEMTGTLMVDEKTPLKVDGKPVTSTVKFTPEESSGTVEIPFTFDGSAITDVDQLVAFEELTNDSVLVAKHKDIEDKDQTVTVPRIGTTLKTSDGDKELIVDGKVSLTDTIKYENLTPGTEYEMTGTLMIDKDTPLTINGKDVTNTVKFTPEKESGSVDVTFEFDSSVLKDKDIEKLVAFEELTNDSVLVAQHKDIDDENQTVSVTVPEEPKTPFAQTNKDAGATPTLLISILALLAVGSVATYVYYNRKKKAE